MGRERNQKRLPAMQDLKRERIVLISSALFLEAGIEDVKMTDIAEECDVGVATLYRYFGTKTKLLIEVGTMLWKDLEKLFHDTFSSSSYEKKNGIGQIETLLSIYEKLYGTQREFLKFLGEFDALMLEEKVTKTELQGYEKSIFDFYSVGDRAFVKGQQDGSIRKEVDFSQVYYAFTHAILGMCQKFNRGPILSGDMQEDGAKEISQLIQMAVYYLKRQEA